MKSFDTWLNEIAPASQAPTGLWQTWNELRTSKDMYRISAYINKLTRYLNGQMPYVNAETKERIMAFMPGFTSEFYRGISPDRWKEWTRDLQYIVSRLTK